MLQVNLVLIEQVQEDVIIMTKSCKQRMAQCFNSKLTLRQFKEGDFVWRARGEAHKD